MSTVEETSVAPEDDIIDGFADGPSDPAERADADDDTSSAASSPAEEQAAAEAELPPPPDAPPAETAAQAAQIPEEIEPAGESFPPQLLSRAGGLSEAAARAQFGSPQRLEDALTALDGQMLLLGRQRLMQQQTPGAPVAGMPPGGVPPQQQIPPGQQPQQVAAPEPAPSAEPAVSPFLLQALNLPEEYADNEDTAAVINSVASQIGQFYAPHFEQLVQRTNHLESLLSAELNARQVEMQRQADGEWDKWFNDQGDEWESVFGKGTHPSYGGKDALDPSSVAVQNRAAVIAQAKLLNQVRHSQGFPPYSMADAAEAVKRQLFSETQDSITRQQGASQAAQRHLTPRPTNRTTASSVETQAAERWDTMRRENGVAAASDLGDL